MNLTSNEVTTVLKYINYKNKLDIDEYNKMVEDGGFLEHNKVHFDGNVYYRHDISGNRIESKFKHRLYNDGIIVDKYL